MIIDNPEIKGENLPKIIDLGFSKDVGDDDLTKTMLGSYQYMAPEIVWS